MKKANRGGIEICGRCSTPLTEENWAPSYRKKRYLICRLCDNTRQRAYNKARPDVVWKRNKQKLYGLTYEAYQRLLDKQGGSCAICKSVDPGRGHKHLFVDHCHSSGTIRGLLCHRCNVGLGQFRDSPDLLQQAKEYLTNDQM